MTITSIDDFYMALNNKTLTIKQAEAFNKKYNKSLFSKKTLKDLNSLLSTEKYPENLLTSCLKTNQYELFDFFLNMDSNAAYKKNIYGENAIILAIQYNLDIQLHKIINTIYDNEEFSFIGKNLTSEGFNIINLAIKNNNTYATNILLSILENQLNKINVFPREAHRTLTVYSQYDSYINHQTIPLSIQAIIHSDDLNLFSRIENIRSLIVSISRWSNTMTVRESNDNVFIYALKYNRVNILKYLLNKFNNEIIKVNNLMGENFITLSQKPEYINTDSAKLIHEFFKIDVNIANKDIQNNENIQNNDLPSLPSISVNDPETKENHELIFAAINTIELLIGRTFVPTDIDDLLLLKNINDESTFLIKLKEFSSKNKILSFSDLNNDQSLDYNRLFEAATFSKKISLYLFQNNFQFTESTKRKPAI